MAVTNLILLCGTAVVTIASAYLGKDAPSKKTQAIQSYGQCLSQTKDEVLCGKILEAGDVVKPGTTVETKMAEVKPRNRGEN